MAKGISPDRRRDAPHFAYPRENTRTGFNGIALKWRKIPRNSPNYHPDHHCRFIGYEVYTYVDGRKKHIGYFHHLYEAVVARVKWAAAHGQSYRVSKAEWSKLKEVYHINIEDNRYDDELDAFDGFVNCTFPLDPS